MKRKETEIAMYSTRMKRKSAMREVELRVEGVTRRAREHEARERS